MSSRFVNDLAITALVCGGAVCWGQSPAMERMKVVVTGRLVDRGLTGETNRKPSQTFSGAIAKPMAELAEGLRGSAERKPVQQPNDSSRTDVVTITSARTARLEASAEATPAKPEIARLAARTHAELDAFDPRALFITPLDGSILAPTQLFAWTAGTGVQDHYLRIGSCYDCKDLLDEDEGLRGSRIAGMPSDGRLVYATLFSYIAGYWYYADYQFTAPTQVTPAYLTNPTNGSTLDNPQTFTWTAGANVSAYSLRLGSCQDCGDLLNENEGTNLTRTTNLPLDGRTVFATLFSYSNGFWFWVDYQFRAGTGNPVRVTVTNNLAYSLNIYVNGISVGSVEPFKTQYADALAASLTVSFDMARPTLDGRALGDTFAGIFDRIERASGNYNFSVSNLIGTDWFFMPEISNQTGAPLDIEVNGGLKAENRCGCAAPAYTTNVASGYYHLYSNSNVRLFRSGTSYTGPYWYWGQDANGNISPSGLLYKLAAADTGIVRLTTYNEP